MASLANVPGDGFYFRFRKVSERYASFKYITALGYSKGKIVSFSTLRFVDGRKIETRELPTLRSNGSAIDRRTINRELVGSDVISWIGQKSVPHRTIID